MANRLNPNGREAFAEGLIDWTSDDIKIIALTSAYSYNAAHVFVSSLSGIVARSANITGKSDTGGVLKGDSALFALLTGSTIASMYIVKDTGNDATSRLLYFIDTGNNLPTIPDGLDLYVQPDPTTGYFQV